MIRPFVALLCPVCLATSAPLPPGEEALAYLGRIAAGNPRIEETTAISPDTTKEKLEEIRDWLGQLGERLEAGRFEILEARTDGGLAAALISQVNDFDPATAQVHAIGLVRRGEVWLPAPVPASFENTGLRYHPSLGEAATRLEEWMLGERPVFLDRLRAGLDERLLAEIRESFDRDEFRGLDAGRVADRFLEACRGSELAVILGLLGGMEEPPPAGWRESVSVVAAGLRAAEAGSGPWAEAFAQPRIAVAVRAESGEDEAWVDVGFFDPAERSRDAERVRIRRIGLARAESGGWRVKLPGWLEGGDGLPVAEVADRELREAFALAVFEKAGPQGFPSPRELGEAVMRGLSGDRLEPMLRWVGVEDGEAAMRALESYARLWSRRGESRDLRLLLDTHAEGGRACGLYCGIDPYQPEIRVERIRRLLMVRGSLGWRLAPEASPALADLPDALRKWADEAAGRGGGDWLDRLGLGDRLGGLPADSAPDREAAGRVAGEWSAALDRRDMRRILGLSTLFDDARSMGRYFAFLGRELADHGSREILGIHRHGRWAAASIRHRPPPGGEEPPLDLLHPLVATAGGPRVLPEAVLYVPDSRARVFLNNEVWKRLGERLPEAAVGELRTLAEAHADLCRTVGESQD